MINKIKDGIDWVKYGSGWVKGGIKGGIKYGIGWVKGGIKYGIGWVKGGIKDGFDWVMYYGEKHPFYRFCATMAAVFISVAAVAYFY